MVRWVPRYRKLRGSEGLRGGLVPRGAEFPAPPVSRQPVFRDKWLGRAIGGAELCIRYRVQLSGKKCSILSEPLACNAENLA